MSAIQVVVELHLCRLPLRNGMHTQVQVHQWELDRYLRML